MWSDCPAFAVIAQIRNILIDDSSIFVGSSSGQGGSFFYRFSIEGKFLNRIGAIGRGPGESLNSSFTLDKEGNRFLVLRLDGKKCILAYNYGGTFLGELPIAVPDDVADFACLTGGRIVFQPIAKGIPAQILPDLNLFELYDSLGDLLDRKIHPIVQFRDISYDKMLRTAINGGISLSRGEALLFHERDDTIYRTLHEKILPAFILQKGKYTPPFLDRYKAINLAQYPYLIDKGPWILETDSLVFLRQGLENKLYLFEYNKESGKTRSSHTIAESGSGSGGYLFNDLPGFIDNISGSGHKMIFRQRTGSQGSIIAVPYTASQFIEEFSNVNRSLQINANSKCSEQRELLIERITENDNPIIVLVYLN